MEVIPFEAPGQDVDDAYLSHLFLHQRILADVQKDEQADKKKFVLFPYQNVKFFELGFCTDFVFFLIFSPHFDVFAVEEIESLNLMAEDINDGFANLMLGDIRLKLPVMREYVEH